MASFALPNMLPNSPSHSSFRFPSLLFIVLIPRLLSLVVLYANAQPFLTNIPQQLQAFQLQIQQQSNQPQRKSLFSPYLPAASLPPLLAAGKLVIGILRVNKRNRSDAYISTEVLDADIYISGSRDRNRALDGDTVAVELLDVDEVWAAKKEKEDKKRKKVEVSSLTLYLRLSVSRRLTISFLLLLRVRVLCSSTTKRSRTRLSLVRS
jgi:protein SSD1